LESTGVLVAIGLAVIVLAWLVAPHVGKVCMSEKVLFLFTYPLAAFESCNL